MTSSLFTAPLAVVKPQRGESDVSELTAITSDDVALAIDDVIATDDVVIPTRKDQLDVNNDLNRLE